MGSVQMIFVFLRALFRSQAGPAAGSNATEPRVSGLQTGVILPPARFHKSFCSKHLLAAGSNDSAAIWVLSNDHPRGTDAPTCIATPAEGSQKNRSGRKRELFSTSQPARRIARNAAT